MLQMTLVDRMYKLFLALRALLYYIWLGVTAIIFNLMLYFVLFLPFNKGRMQITRTWCHLARLGGKWICGMNYRILGKENCPQTASIYLSKHQSAWETIVFQGLLPPNCFVTKASVLKIPFFGWGMRISKHIPIDRNAGIRAFKKVIQAGKERLHEGLSVIIFPEGTRVAPHMHPEFHRTAVLLAKETGAAVVPIAHNSGSCWRRNQFLKYPGTITVVIGPPIDSKNLSTAELNAAVYEWIKQEMLKLEA